MKESLFGLCTHAVAEATQILEKFMDGAVDFSAKESPRDLVSDADLAVQRHIIQAIGSSGFPVVSEEQANDLTALTSSEFCWVLDPIDGTTNFASGIPFFGISLGLLRKGDFYAGAFAMPATKELFYTLDEDVAYRNEKRLRVQNEPLSSSLVGASFSSRKYGTELERSQEFVAFGEINDQSRGALRLGAAAVNICYAATGKLGLAYGHKNKIWDVAGALAVARAAGCTVCCSTPDGDGNVSFMAGTPLAVDGAKRRLEKALGVTW